MSEDIIRGIKTKKYRTELNLRTKPEQYSSLYIYDSPNDESGMYLEIPLNDMREFLILLQKSLLEFFAIEIELPFR